MALSSDLITTARQAAPREEQVDFITLALGMTRS
jgi:hypothetical protein